MARKSRRNHTPTFKARVALEAWREKSVAELAKKYEMHTTQINDWKRRRVIERPNQVWALDTTYIPMSSGFVYLTAVIDVATRAVLSHRVATTLESCHAVETLEMAFERHGTPQIVNADQGSRFTAEDFVNAVKTRGCQFSVDGREAWRDNVFGNGLGGRSSTARCTSKPTTASQLFGAQSTASSTGTTTTELTRRSVERPRCGSMTNRCPRLNWQLD